MNEADFWRSGTLRPSRPFNDRPATIVRVIIVIRSTRGKKVPPFRAVHIRVCRFGEARFSSRLTREHHGCYG
jgi:hypothetical protein